jgi:FkbM family methyltransferase
LVDLAKGTEVVFDVGANIGLYSIVLARTIAPQGTVYAFEPHPETARILEEHAALNHVTNVRGFPIALGERDAAEVLRDVGRHDLGKFSLRGDSSTAGVEVHVRTLDGMFRELGLQRLDLLKIDVEGHEPEVFLGGFETIGRYRPKICFELSPEWYADRTEKTRGILERLVALGYRFESIEKKGPRRPIELLQALAERKQRNLVALP